MSIIGKCKHSKSAYNCANEQTRNDVKTLIYGDTDDDVPELEEREIKKLCLSPKLEAEQEIKKCLANLLSRVEHFASNAKALGFVNRASVCTPENELFVQRQKFYNVCAQQDNFDNSRQKYTAWIMKIDRPTMAEEEVQNQNPFFEHDQSAAIDGHVGEWV